MRMWLRNKGNEGFYGRVERGLCCDDGLSRVPYVTSSSSIIITALSSYFRLDRIDEQLFTAILDTQPAVATRHLTR